eukprot:ctg_1160.g515
MVMRYGDKAWTAVASGLPGRTSKQGRGVAGATRKVRQQVGADQQAHARAHRQRHQEPLEQHHASAVAGQSGGGAGGRSAVECAHGQAGADLRLAGGDRVVHQRHAVGGRGGAGGGVGATVDTAGFAIGASGDGDRTSQLFGDALGDRGGGEFSEQLGAVVAGQSVIAGCASFGQSGVVAAAAAAAAAGVGGERRGIDGGGGFGSPHVVGAAVVAAEPLLELQLVVQPARRPGQFGGASGRTAAAQLQSGGEPGDHAPHRLESLRGAGVVAGRRPSVRVTAADYDGRGHCIEASGADSRRVLFVAAAERHAAAAAEFDWGVLSSPRCDELSQTQASSYTAGVEAHTVDDPSDEDGWGANWMGGASAFSTSEHRPSSCESSMDEPYQEMMSRPDTCKEAIELPHCDRRRGHIGYRGVSPSSSRVRAREYASTRHRERVTAPDRLHNTRWSRWVAGIRWLHRAPRRTHDRESVYPRNDKGSSTLPVRGMRRNAWWPRWRPQGSRSQTTSRTPSGAAATPLGRGAGDVCRAPVVWCRQVARARLAAPARAPGASTSAAAGDWHCVLGWCGQRSTAPRKRPRWWCRSSCWSPAPRRPSAASILRPAASAPVGVEYPAPSAVDQETSPPNRVPACRASAPAARGDEIPPAASKRPPRRRVTGSPWPRSPCRPVQVAVLAIVTLVAPPTTAASVTAGHASAGTPRGTVAARTRPAATVAGRRARQRVRPTRGATRQGHAPRPAKRRMTWGGQAGYPLRSGRPSLRHSPATATWTRSERYAPTGVGPHSNPVTDVSRVSAQTRTERSPLRSPGYPISSHDHIGAVALGAPQHSGDLFGCFRDGFHHPLGLLSYALHVALADGHILLQVDADGGQARAGAAQPHHQARRAVRTEEYANALAFGARTIHWVGVAKVVGVDDAVSREGAGQGARLHLLPQILHQLLRDVRTHIVKIPSRVIVAAVGGPVFPHHLLHADRQRAPRSVAVAMFQNGHPAEHRPQAVLLADVIAARTETLLATHGHQAGIEQVAEKLPPGGRLVAAHAQTLGHAVQSATARPARADSGRAAHPRNVAWERRDAAAGSDARRGFRRRGERRWDRWHRSCVEGHVKIGTREQGAQPRKVEQRAQPVDVHYGGIQQVQLEGRLSAGAAPRRLIAPVHAHHPKAVHGVDALHVDAGETVRAVGVAALFDHHLEIAVDGLRAPVDLFA